MFTFTVHSHPVEWLFTFLSSIGFVVAVYSFLDAQKYKSLRGISEGLKLSAEQQITMDFFRAVIHSYLMVASISFIFTAPPPPDYGFLPQSLLGMTLWNLVSATLTFSSIRNLHFRHHLEEVAARELAREEQKKIKAQEEAIKAAEQRRRATDSQSSISEGGQ